MVGLMIQPPVKQLTTQSQKALKIRIRRNKAAQSDLQRFQKLQLSVLTQNYCVKGFKDWFENMSKETKD